MCSSDLREVPADVDCNSYCSWMVAVVTSEARRAAVLGHPPESRNGCDRGVLLHGWAPSLGLAVIGKFASRNVCTRLITVPDKAKCYGSLHEVIPCFRTMHYLYLKIGSRKSALWF